MCLDFLVYPKKQVMGILYSSMDIEKFIFKGYT